MERSDIENIMPISDIPVMNTAFFWHLLDPLLQSITTCLQ